MNAIGLSKVTEEARGERGVPPLILASGVLTIIGLIAAGYLSYSSLTGSHLVCAGLGDCNAVQASIYAKLAGIPVSLFGLASYVAIASLLLVRLKLSGMIGYLADLGVLGLCLSGWVFSMFLTYVELFILHAICPWCVTSAVMMTLLAILSSLRVFQDISAA